MGGGGGGGTYSIEQGPTWEDDSFSASKEVHRNLWKSKVHYHVYESPQPDPNLSQINPVHTPCSNSWRSSLILSFHLRALILIHAWVFQVVSFLQVPQPKPWMHLPSPRTCYMRRQSNSSRFEKNEIGSRTSNQKCLQGVVVTPPQIKTVVCLDLMPGTYQPTYLPTYLTPCSRIVFLKVNRSSTSLATPRIYETRSFLTSFTIPHHLTILINPV